MRHTFKNVKTNEEFSFELEVKYQEIAHQIAARMVRSKTGKITAMKGAIVAKRVKEK